MMFIKLVEEYKKLSADDYSGLFKLVMKLVDQEMDKKRYGLLLGLIELGFERGNFIGGLHVVGTNEIYLNKSALRVMKEESKVEYFKAYIFFVLLHEYIHAVGVVNEQQTRRLTKEIVLTVFGTQHPISQLAIKGLNRFFPYTFNRRSYRPSQQERRSAEYILRSHSDSELTYS